MNKNRRAALSKICDRVNDLSEHLDALCALPSLIEGIKSDLESIKDEEEDYVNNMPESLQSSDKYSDAEEAVNEMEAALEKLEEMADMVDALKDFDLDDVINTIDNARGQA